MCASEYRSKAWLGFSADIHRFVSSLPPQLENRISPAAFAFFVQAINIHLRDAYSVGGAIVDNVIAVATLWTSLCWRTSHFEKVCPVVRVPRLGSANCA